MRALDASAVVALRGVTLAKPTPPLVVGLLPLSPYSEGLLAGPAASLRLRGVCDASRRRPKLYAYGKRPHVKAGGSD